MERSQKRGDLFFTEQLTGSDEEVRDPRGDFHVVRVTYIESLTTSIFLAKHDYDITNVEPDRQIFLLEVL